MYVSMEEVKEQQSTLQFSGFDHKTAAEIGIQLYQMAAERRLPVAIDISRGRHQVFHVALPGATADNDEWLKRKSNTVYRFEVSSMFMQLKMKEKGKSISDIYSVSLDSYAEAGGAFPIIVKGTGMVGVIAVSGLTSEEDHGLIIEVLRKYLA